MDTKHTHTHIRVALELKEHLSTEYCKNVDWRDHDVMHTSYNRIDGYTSYHDYIN